MFLESPRMKAIIPYLYRKCYYLNVKTFRISDIVSHNFHFHFAPRAALLFFRFYAKLAGRVS